MNLAEPRARTLALIVFPTLCLTLGAGCSSAGQDDLAGGGDTEGSGAGSTSGDGGGTSGFPGSSTSGGGTTDASDSGYPGGTSGDGGTEGEEPDESDGGTTTGEPAECDAQTPVELFLSPDDSNSMSSPVQARDSVMRGWGLWSVPIRTWEFLNYYKFDYPAAAAGELAIFPSMAHDEGMAEGEYKLQIGISSPAISNDDRAPLNITLVLDESGSMSGEPMSMLKASCRAIASSLREGDVVSMVTWDTSNAIVLGGYHVTGPDDTQLLSAIADLEAGGGTDLHGGLVAGYDLAEQVYDPTRINRIVLISDGGANVGVTDENLIAQKAGANDQDGIYMVGVGVGLDNTYNDALMDTVTDVGKGASVFITSEAEAERIFGDDFVNTLAVAARDVQVQLDMPPGFEIVKFSGEEYSTNPQEVEPQHIAPNDAMVFHQTIATCAPDLATDDAEITVTARYKDAITFEQHEVTSTLTFAELLAADQDQLLKGAAIFAYAEALTASREGLDGAAVQEALAALVVAEAALPGDPDLAEIRMVLEAL